MNHAAAQAVDAVVCLGDDFVSGLEFLDDNDRSEDFFLADAEFIALEVFEDGRTDEEALVAAVFGVAFTAGDETAAFFLADLDVVQHFLELFFVDDSAELGVHVGGIANLDAFEGSFQTGYEFVIDAFLNEYAEPAQQTWP